MLAHGVGAKLDRIEYDKPPIVKVAIQVVLPWTQPEMLKAAEELEESAKGFFATVERIEQQEFRVEATPAGISQKLTKTPMGLKCTDVSGLETSLEAAGVRSVHSFARGNYVGRDQAMQGVVWCCEQLRQRYPDLIAVRVSTLVENRIETPKSGNFHFEDYVVPNFELADERLNFFHMFEHNVHLELSELAGQPMRGIVILRYPADPPGEGQGGEIALIIDILDESQTSISQVKERVIRVKDVETHVFENSITQKTREMYGPRN